MEISASPDREDQYLVAIKILAKESGVDCDKIRLGLYTREEEATIINAISRLQLKDN